MAATYNSVTFEVLLDGQDFMPGWARPNNVSVRNIPYGNKDNVQGAGPGNFSITVTAIVESDADLATLQASVGATSRSLATFLGATYGSAYLIACDNPRRQATRAYWFVDLTFMREGT